MTAKRWAALMLSLGMPPNKDTCAALIAAYLEPQRHYHTARHISDCLTKLDAAKHIGHEPAEIETAIWFHDAVYLPYSAGNEAKSAAWAEKFMRKNGAAEQRIKRVVDLIMATQHAVPAFTHDAKLMVDIDLSILGADQADYAEFETNVRKEYRWVPYFLYRKKRAEILKSFLTRERIYENEFFFTQYERNARKNLSAAIANLGAK